MWIIRLFGLGASLLSGYLIYYNWQRALTEHKYSLQLTTIAPIMVLLGLYVMIFPTKIGRPETTLDKIVALLLVIVGAAAGAYNWYLIDPGQFSFLMK